MTMSVEIPADLEPLLAQAIANGTYANEQELVAGILRIAAPALEGYRQLKAQVQKSLQEEEAGLVEDADFEAVRQQLRDEYDPSGQRK